MREALGDLDDTTAFVNVSDGGHLENLGVYELLKRRCRFIIAVDAGADPSYHCSDLSKIMQLARSDLGIRIEVSQDDIDRVTACGAESEDSSVEKNHWIVGTIDYGDSEQGHLLYLKSSLSGDENPYVQAYDRKEPAFPHQSTGDQFFSEDQFEAYRALGFHVANRFFEERPTDQFPL